MGDANGEYRRPAIEEKQFFDETGQVIRYGTRWQSGNDWSPPEESYSRESNVQRFDPLHKIADAMIEYLQNEFDVVIETGDGLLEGLLHVAEPEKRLKVVRISPEAPGASAITFVFTNYPGVVVYAGALFMRHYPSCGCDACDETWQSAADGLEQVVFGIVDGGFSEKISAPKKPKTTFKWGMGFVRGYGQTIEYSLSYQDGSESGMTGVEGVPVEALSKAIETLNELEATTGTTFWKAWDNRAQQPELF